MLVCGLDPGLRHTGYGIIDAEGRSVKLIDAGVISPPVQDDLPDRLAGLDSTLSCLERTDARSATVFELRFFGGLSVQEAAEVLSVSPDTVMRDWKLSKAWLLRELTDEA